MKYVFVVCGLCLSFAVTAQKKILDDSTNNVYDEKTTLYFTEKSFFSDSLPTFQRIDSTYLKFHRFDSLQTFKTKEYRYLSSFGTAVRPLEFILHSQVQQRSGLESFQAYRFDFLQIPYYQTRSPFTEIHWANAGAGQGFLQVQFSRNSHKNLNFGFQMQRVAAYKTYGPVINAESFLVDAWNYRIHANYISKNNKYLFLGNIIRRIHTNSDLGGYIYGLKSTQELFKLPLANALAATQNAQSEESDWEIYALQKYRWTQVISIFYKTHLSISSYKFQDISLKKSVENKAYPGISFSEIELKSNKDTIFQRYDFLRLTNEFSIKTQIKNYELLAYIKRNDIQWKTESDILTTKNGYEHWTGGLISWHTKKFKAIGELDYNFSDNWQLSFLLQNSFARLKLRQIRYTSPLIYQNSSSILSVLNYSNTPQAILAEQLTADFVLENSLFVLKPYLEYNQLHDYLYLDAKAQPNTFSGNLLKIGYRFETKLKKWHFQQSFRWQESPYLQELGLPALSSFFSPSFEFKFRKVMQTEVGLDFQYTSSYFAPRYLPINQQFYQQSIEKSSHYLWLNAFVNFKIGKVRLYIRMSHLNQGWWNAGYWVSAFHPANESSFGFGVNWKLYD